jgi:hypothetical protein
MYFMALDDLHVYCEKLLSRMTDITARLKLLADTLERRLALEKLFQAPNANQTREEKK